MSEEYALDEGEEIVLRRSRRTNSERVAECYILGGRPGIHWRYIDE